MSLTWVFEFLCSGETYSINVDVVTLYVKSFLLFSNLFGDVFCPYEGIYPVEFGCFD